MSEDREGQVTLVPRPGRQLLFRDGAFVELPHKDIEPERPKDKRPRDAKPETGGDSSDDKPKKPSEGSSAKPGEIYPPYWPINVGAYIVHHAELKNIPEFTSLQALKHELPDLTAKLKSGASQIPVAVHVKSPVKLEELKELSKHVGGGKHLIILVEPTSERE
jgi:hypothetical protein